MAQVRTIRVGLTGGIGSGKSYVAGLLEASGIPVYNSDREARRLMLEEPEVKSRVIALLGQESYQGDELNREYIARRVFGNPEILAALNSIVHPAVRNDFEKWVAKQPVRLVVQESALIFEHQYESRYDRIILVTVPLGLRIHRVCLRDGISEEEVLRRVSNQLPDSLKLPRADFHIRNIFRAETDQQVAAMALFLKSLELEEH